MKNTLTIAALILVAAIFTSCQIDGPAGIELDETILSLAEGDTQTLTATITPPNASNKNVTWSSSNSAVATVDASGKVTALKAGTATITVRTTDGRYTASCEITVVDYSKPIDLGLSVKWAQVNLGASSPEQDGGYYQWAGIQDVTSKSIYVDLDNCPYYTGTDLQIWTTKWTKYVQRDTPSYWSGPGSPDNKTILDPNDDVAHVKLGGKWRMPTREEWQELIDNCTSEWTTFEGGPRYGRKFTSKKNGNSIFLLPTACRCGDYFGSYGYYWSSSLSSMNPAGAYAMYLESGYAEISPFRYRYFGHSVRPVSEY